MDASKADFGAPSGNTNNTSNKGSDHSHSRFAPGSGYYGETRTKTGGGGGEKPPGTNTGKDVPFEKPVPNIGLVTGLINLGAYANYKGRQNFAKKEGLYRDFYRANKTPLQPNSPVGKSYLKEAGYGKTPEMTPDRGGSPTSVPPPTAVAAKPVTAVPKPFKPYFMGFDFQKPIDETKQRRLPTSSFKQGGLSGGKRFGPPPKKGPNPHGICPHRKDGIRGVGAVEKGRGVKFVGVK